MVNTLLRAVLKQFLRNEAYSNNIVIKVIHVLQALPFSIPGSVPKVPPFWKWLWRYWKVWIAFYYFLVLYEDDNVMPVMPAFVFLYYQHWDWPRKSSFTKTLIMQKLQFFWLLRQIMHWKEETGLQKRSQITSHNSNISNL